MEAIANINGRTVLTAAELMAFAGGHRLPLPAGVPAAAEALPTPEARDSVLEHASLCLYTRGVSLIDDEGPVANPALDQMLRVLCRPLSRVVISRGTASASTQQAISIGAEYSVLQAWDRLGLHFLYLAGLGETLDAVHASAGESEVAARRPAPRTTVIDAARVERIGGGSPDVARSMVAEEFLDSLSVGEQASFVGALVGDVAGTTMLFSTWNQAGHSEELISWFDAGDAGAWRFQAIGFGAEGGADGGGGLRITLVGRDDLVALVDQAYGRLTVPTAT
ncbi:MAG: hypothetical protein M0Z95_11995 [Actinomycetota bacterium]|jgi:hypothetical protein|nr:hypothetical protein [Actinomycetota bacterium]